MHVRPPASNFLPPRPLAYRDRRGRPGRRALTALGIGALMVVVVPFGFAALGSAGHGFEPLGGGVAGAVSGTLPPAPSAPSEGPDATPAPSPVPSASPPPVGEPSQPPVAPLLSSLTGYRWPIGKGQISLPFKDIPGGTRIRNGRLMHDGVDMASFCGARVGAAHEGIVLAAGRHFDEQVGWVGDLTPYLHLLDVHHLWNDLPNVVVIDDGNGYRSIYAHFRDVTVKVGQHVVAGQMIGHEGMTGHASGCHVHYGLFSPFETKTFGVRADILRRLRVPPYEIARVDPLLVLPGGDVALRTRQIATAIAAAKAEIVVTARARVLANAPRAE